MWDLLKTAINLIRLISSFQGIKIDFFSDHDDSQAHIGYCNILPVHLDKDCGKLVFSINGLHTFPVGQVTGEWIAHVYEYPTQCIISEFPDTLNQW